MLILWMAICRDNACFLSMWKCCIGYMCVVLYTEWKLYNFMAIKSFHCHCHCQNFRNDISYTFDKILCKKLILNISKFGSNITMFSSIRSLCHFRDTKGTFIYDDRYIRPQGSDIIRSFIYNIKEHKAHEKYSLYQPASSKLWEVIQCE